MRKKITILLISGTAALIIACAVYGQAKEYADKLRESERHIEFLKKVETTISAIEADRKLPVEMKIIDIADLLVSIPDYVPPSPFVTDVESIGPYSRGTGTSFAGAENEPFEGRLSPDELLGVIIRMTGAENWDTTERAGQECSIKMRSGKIFVTHTPEMIKKVESAISDFRKKLPPLISSTIYLLAADEEYLGQLREKGSSVVSAEAIKKLISDAKQAGKVELLRTGYLTAFSSQTAYLYCGATHTYQGDTDTSGQGGLAPFEIFDPIINVFNEGLIVGLQAQYNSQTGQTNILATVSLSKLTAIEKHTGIGGLGLSEPGKEAEGKARKCEVETPKVDLQIVSGTGDVPAGCGLLLGGSRIKTAQAEQKSFVVIIVPAVQGQ
jgi:hypothetical protein